MIEQSIAFGKSGNLVGTICLPDTLSANTPSTNTGMVLFNAGVVHRIGPYRINVRLARQLALRGIPSIRFDLAGQGDSERAPGGLSFEAQSVEDLNDALDALNRAANVSRFALFGFCSGGIHSYAAAQVDTRIAGIMLYDTFTYPTFRSWLKRYIDSIREKGFARAFGDWVERRLPAPLRGADAAEKNLPPTGPPNVGLYTIPTPAELARVLAQLHARGTRICVAYAGSSFYYRYRKQFSDTFKPYGADKFVVVEYFEQMNHTATLISQQQQFMDYIANWSTKVAGIPERKVGANSGP